MIVKDLVNACHDADVLNALQEIGMSSDNPHRWRRGCESILRKFHKITPAKTDRVLIIFEPSSNLKLSFEILDIERIQKGFFFHPEWDKVIDADYPDKESFIKVAGTMNVSLRCCPEEVVDEYMYWDLMLGCQIEEKDVEKYGKELLLAMIITHIARDGYSEREIRKSYGEDDWNDDETKKAIMDEAEKRLDALFGDEEDEDEEDDVLFPDLPEGVTEEYIPWLKPYVIADILDRYRVIREYYVRHFGK